MTSYGEIIEEQRGKLNSNISWWPLYLYHFTDVHNAVSIWEQLCKRTYRFNVLAYCNKNSIISSSTI